MMKYRDSYRHPRRASGSLNRDVYLPMETAATQGGWWGLRAQAALAVATELASQPWN